ncbi:hypothetical protein ANCDUO_17944 [Ancylostoma duodenale]|uniref:Neurogenic differentiation factor domain-containing protein n=1 Tax=Ancylostoma duodenale TaxID=51022 RepID=A0A0C2G4I7_9BILA|nr:hypothetical protein ANCDUO_17944 [Ancylostoma duodenale]
MKHIRANHSATSKTQQNRDTSISKKNGTTATFRNYILALQRMLQTGRQPTPLEYAHQLSIGLSQTTTNMLANLLQMDRD